MTMFAVSPDPAVSRLVERCGYATAALNRMDGATRDTFLHQMRRAA